MVGAQLIDNGAMQGQRLHRIERHGGGHAWARVEHGKFSEQVARAEDAQGGHLTGGGGEAYRHVTLVDEVHGIPRISLAEDGFVVPELTTSRHGQHGPFVALGELAEDVEAGHAGTVLRRAERRRASPPHSHGLE